MAFSGLKKWIMLRFARSVVGDIEKGEYGMNVKGVLDWLNGRKQAIGLLLLFLTQVQAQVPEIVAAFGANPDTVTVVGNVLGGIVLFVGSVHKLIKGQ